MGQPDYPGANQGTPILCAKSRSEQLISHHRSCPLHNQSDLEQTILLDNPFAGIRQTRLSEIVLQVANHGSYHRGNVSTMLRQVGYASTMNDYSLFWYQVPAEAI